MFREPLLLILISACLFAQGGGGAAKSVGACCVEIKSAAPGGGGGVRGPSAADLVKASFKGVSFSYEPKIFGEFAPAEYPERPLESVDEKPDGVRARLIQFESSKDSRRFRISVQPLEDYRRMYAVSPEMTKWFDEKLKDLRARLRTGTFRPNKEIPYLPYLDAHQTVRARVKPFPFGSGRGFFFLTQYDQDAVSYVNNDDLVYIYQGITSDGKNYVEAEFHVRASFLPVGPEARERGFEGYRLPLEGDLTAAQKRRYKQYLANVTRRLDRLPAGEFEPNLKYIEEIISSLKIEK